MSEARETPQTCDDDLDARYPREVRSGNGTSAAIYLLQSGYYAVHELPPDRAAPGAVQLLNDGVIALYAGTPGGAADRRGGTLGPVYALQPGGSLAVPTGLVFLRFAEGISADSRCEAIRSAGFDIVTSPRYAPYAAWVRPPSGGIAAALDGLPSLRGLPEVESVEPQMLMARGLRRTAPPDASQV